MLPVAASAPATTDRATLDVTALLRHVVDVEASLPPPRRRLHHYTESNCTQQQQENTINTRPDVQILQLPRHDRRLDEVDFDDEDVDLFVVAARTSRVVGAGLVTVSRQGSSSRGTADDIDGSSGMGPLSMDANDNSSNGGDNDIDASSGCCGDLTDPMGGDRYGPVTICCAYCEDEEDDDENDADNGDGDGDEDEQLDEMITCLSILVLQDSSSSSANDNIGILGGGGTNSNRNQNHQSHNEDQKQDQNVAIVLGTSFGRVLSTELCIHHGRGIRRADGGGGGGGGGGGDPFEPLVLDYDDDEEVEDVYEYYDEDGRRSFGHGGGGSGGGGDELKGSSSHSAGAAAAAAGASGGTAAAASGGGDGNQRFFHPEGGIKSIQVHVDRQEQQGREGGDDSSSSAAHLRPASSSTVSVTYGDGTCVRLPHYGLFKSIVTALNNENSSVKVPIRRYKVNGFSGWNGTNVEGGVAAQAGGSDVLFLPKSHPSLLAPLPAGKSSTCLLPDSRPGSPSPTSDGDSAEAMDADPDAGHEEENGQQRQDVDENDYDFCEAVTFGCSGDALRFHSSTEGPPPLFSQGDDNAQNVDASSDGGGVQLGMVTGAVVGVAAGMFGAALGAVSWGLGGGTSTDAKHEEDSVIDETDSKLKDQMKPKDALSRLRDRPVGDLTSATSSLDPPRKVTSVVIDPDGDLAATADSLGRVLLIDLATKQLLRIWKGVRDASCCWIQIPRPPHLAQWGKKTQLYLAIHSGQRRVVEVWRVRHGPRVGIHSVGRNARLVPCQGPACEGAMARCFILDPSLVGGDSNILDSLTIHDPELHPTPVSEVRNGSTSGTSAANAHQAVTLAQSTNGDTIQLQLLKQQLASETNVPSSPKAIYDTLINIGSIAELSNALDVLSTAEHLEDGMGVQGSSLHSHAVEYCEKRLESASNDYSNNLHLKTLKMKIIHHKQVISAYDALNKFEAKHQGTVEYVKDTASSSTSWTVEALAWIHTYETATGRSVAETIPQTNLLPLKFATFAKSCMQLNANDVAAAERLQNGEEEIRPIHLIDSKRDRTVVLVRIFRPLLMDVFVFKVVNTVFDCLAISQDKALMQQYFGEWFVALSGKLESKKDLMVRWLKDMVLEILDEEERESPGAQKHQILLQELHRFCSSSDDLSRAFLLASICHEAVSAATQQREAKTYGKISNAVEVVPWEQLLRKLRVCLLITLRLSGVQLGSFPVTIFNIDDGGIFSIYQWIARDELSVSHKHGELILLEDMCRTSQEAFDPSSAEGDPPARWKLLQESCRLGVAANRGDLLLLHLRGYDHPINLAAHRALILGEEWGKNPSSVELVKDAVSALHSLGDGGDQSCPLAAAVRLEFWQTRIRPIYRALLFGFEDVPELSEDIMRELCQDFDWVHELGRVALDVLALIAETLPSAIDVNNTEPTAMGLGSAAASGFAIKSILGNGGDAINNNTDNKADGCNNFWPKTKDDVILNSLVSKTRPVESTSLDVHRAIVCAARLTDDLSSLSYCVPSSSDVFLQGSLFSEMSAPTEFNESQEEFLNDIVLKKALQAEGQTVDHIELEEIENLGLAWGVERTRLRAQFLLHMYDVGKDHMVDDLANLSGAQLDFPLVVEGGLEIACARVHSIIIELKKARYREVIGMLDVDTCKWVKREAEESADHLIMSAACNGDYEQDEWQIPPLSSTHSLVLRILRISSNIQDSKSTERAHSLSILSGTLLNAVKENDELKEYGFVWAM